MKATSAAIYLRSDFLAVRKFSILKVNLPDDLASRDRITSLCSPETLAIAETISSPSSSLGLSEVAIA